MPKVLKAYTTLEIIVVIGVMILITGMVIPVSLRQTKLNELSVAGKDLHSAMFVQQQNAYSGKNNAKHGVYVQNDGYWLFEGDSFDTSTTKDYFPYNKGIVTTSGNVEILFDQSSQKPNNEASISLSFLDHTYIVIINSEGAIDSYVLP
jgi:type II secretory pathway pseudopilin PulG